MAKVILSNGTTIEAKIYPAKAEATRRTGHKKEARWTVKSGSKSGQTPGKYSTLVERVKPAIYKEVF